MNDGRPFRICWNRDEATRIFKTEALEGDDAVFLATHSPLAGFEVAGRDAAEVRSPDEQSLLDALSADDRRHAFCVVQGEPGSGKSHLIRWLSVNWPEGRDVKLLLRRADGSLEGALRQLRDRLPPEFHELFEGLGVRQKASHQGRANNFLSWLANTLDPGHYEQRIGDEKWCADYVPGDILGHARVKAQWQAPSRILRLLEGAEGKRNSASASFDVFDLADLGTIVQPVRHMLAAGAKELARRLEAEGAVIEEHRGAGWTAADLAAERAKELPFTLDLVDVLNRRRNDAIQNVLGVSAAGLQSLFRKLRQELQRRCQRLVLLLEDITSWEGLDNSLIDVLVFNAEASGGEAEADVCPLISVVGLTPSYFDGPLQQGNYRQRITHEIRLGQSSGGLQDVAALRDPLERTAFAARYLAAVRAGIPALRAWREDVRDMPALPPPNVCDACPKQPSCHAVFGDRDGVGLFPLTEHALGRFFEALKVDDNGQTWRTPRGILQAVLNPCLSQPELVRDGAFPGRIVESTAIERARLPDNAVSDRLASLVAARVQDVAESARYRRAVTFWGDPERADTTTVDGEVAFAGLRRSLTEAFDLPWLGADEASVAMPSTAPTEPAAPPPTSTAGAPTGTPKVADTETASVEPTPGVGTAGVIRRQERPGPRPAAPARNRRTQTQRESMREELRTWAGGGALENASRWNDLIHEMVSGLDPRAMGVAPPVFQRIVTTDMVKLQGSTTAPRQYLVIPPENWVRAGLEGLLDLELKAGMSEGDRYFSRRNIAMMMGGLERLVARYLRQRLPVLPSGSLWSPVPAMVQVLQARAWLRGAVAPDAPVVDQMRVVLSDEDEAQSDPGSRSAPWMEWLNATRGSHDKIRTDLRAMTSLAVEGGAAGAALVDASEMAGAVARMRERGSMDEMPEQAGSLPDSLASMTKARELVEAWKQARVRVNQIEFAQLKGRAATLAGLLRNRTVASHVDRLGAAITATSALLPSASSDLVAAWIKERLRVEARLADEFAEVEELIVAFDDEASIPASMPLRLKWLSQAPARALEETLSLIQIGERAITALRDHARDATTEGGQAGSLAAVKAIGRELRRVADDVAAGAFS
jgi:hypothetical protein